MLDYWKQKVIFKLDKLFYDTEILRQSQFQQLHEPDHPINISLVNMILIMHNKKKKKRKINKSHAQSNVLL